MSREGDKSDGHVGLTFKPAVRGEKYGTLKFSDKFSDMREVIKSEIKARIWYTVSVQANEEISIYVGGKEVFTYDMAASEIESVSVFTSGARVFLRNLVLSEEEAIELD
jgi:hypothetical protein